MTPELLQPAGQSSLSLPGGNPAGLERISQAFSTARMAGRAALMPYFTLGYPDLETSLGILSAIARAGADLIELGIPFSDPLADGPTIQASTQQALAGGTSLAKCLARTARLRAQGVSQALILMGYYNPLLAYGVQRFVAEATAAGADGFIVPDLPPEEAGVLQAACQSNQRALALMLPPNSGVDRVRLISEQTTGFLYLVSLTGVTGAREKLPERLAEFARRVRPFTRTPLAVGFGISTLAQARAVAEIADGVIVGSALIKSVQAAIDADADPVQAAGTFVGQLRKALDPISRQNTMGHPPDLTSG